jgi:hypothetical protein
LRFGKERGKAKERDLKWGKGTGGLSDWNVLKWDPEAILSLSETIVILRETSVAVQI